MELITQSDDERLKIFECSENCEEHQDEILQSLIKSLHRNNGIVRRLEIKEERLQRAEAEVKRLLKVLEVIASQSSGIPGSTSRSDCMAALAQIELRNRHKGGKNG